MKIKVKYFVVFLIIMAMQNAIGQKNYESKVERLKNLKTEIVNQEKDALKIEIEAINRRLEKKELTDSEAQLLKEEAAKKRALNIENRLSMIDSEIALLERNNGDILVLDSINNGTMVTGVKKITKIIDYLVSG